MKTLIIHKAKQGHGKTSSLNNLIKELCCNHNLKIIYPEELSEINSFFIGKYKDKTIGIITFGDPGCENALQRCLDQCIQEQCDVIISASRTKWGVYDKLNTFAKEHGYNTIETAPIFIANWNHQYPIDKIIHESNCLMTSTLKSLIDTI